VYCVPCSVRLCSIQNVYKILFAYAEVRRVLSHRMCRVSSGTGFDEDLDGLVGSITECSVY
jgi:hypothetical protein